MKLKDVKDCENSSKNFSENLPFESCRRSSKNKLSVAYRITLGGGKRKNETAITVLLSLSKLPKSGENRTSKSVLISRFLKTPFLLVI